MAVALAAFFQVMLWLDPKRRQYAAATAVAVGAVGLADAVPATERSRHWQRDLRPTTTLAKPNWELNGTFAAGGVTAGQPARSLRRS